MKKVNPRKRPCTEADVKRAKSEAANDAVRLTAAIILTVLVDKFNGADYVPEIWEAVNKLAEEVKEGRVNVSDLACVLREEYQIEI